jgi:hypothetical protein
MKNYLSAQEVFGTGAVGLSIAIDKLNNAEVKDVNHFLLYDENDFYLGANLSTLNILAKIKPKFEFVRLDSCHYAGNNFIINNLEIFFIPKKLDSSIIKFYLY